MAYYGGNNDANAHEMIIDACRIASEQNLVDFSEYDNNNDGFVDLVYVIYAGYSEAAGAPGKYGMASCLVYLSGSRTNCKRKRS